VDPQLELFTRALGLEAPWHVVAVDLDAAERRLELRMDFPTGARFPCPETGEPSPVHDTAERRWRHLDFFQHQAFLVAPVPRVRCPDGKVRTVSVPWARPGSGFTLLFEALIMTLAPEMPVRAMAALVGEHDTRLWRVIHHYVDAAWASEDWSAIRRVGIDETSFRRGQDYVSVFADLDRRRVVYAIEGRDAPVVAGFAAELHAHGGRAEQVGEVCQDMSASYIEGVAEHLPEAQITFDRFHVAKLLSEAVDEVRRAERKEHGALLRGSRYLWLRRPETLSARQRERLDGLLCVPLRPRAPIAGALPSTRSSTCRRRPRRRRSAASSAVPCARAWSRSSDSRAPWPSIGRGSCAGGRRRSPTACSRGCTRWCRPPSAAPAATAPPRTTSR